MCIEICNQKTNIGIILYHNRAVGPALAIQPENYTWLEIAKFALPVLNLYRNRRSKCSCRQILHTAVCTLFPFGNNPSTHRGHLRETRLPKEMVQIRVQCSTRVPGKGLNPHLFYETQHEVKKADSQTYTSEIEGRRGK